MSSLKPIIIMFGMVFVVACMLSNIVVAQNCGCRSGVCCSQYGYCGTTAEYCGEGCRQGPCYSSGGGGGGAVTVRSLVTDAFFNGIINRSPSNCAGRNFYSRNAFFNALNFYPQFGTGGSSDVTKREVAAFFAHVTHETGSFCYIEEINKQTYCQASTTWGCNPNKRYYGRGPIQLTWNYNYGPAGRSIGFDGINSPETVANDPVIAFRTAFWFWMNNVHSLILSGQGFGATIRAVNGIECNGGNPGAVSSRIQYYTQYCNQFGVSPGNNLSC